MSTMICLPDNTILIITELPDIGFGMFDGKNSWLLNKTKIFFAMVLHHFQAFMLNLESVVKKEHSEYLRHQVQYFNNK